MRVTVGETPITISPGRVVLAVVALGIVAFGGYDYLQQTEAVEDAVAVEATVIEAGVERVDVRRGVEYEPRIEFRYEYGGATYTSDSLGPSSFSRSYQSRSAAEAAIGEYPLGSTVTAYVDPDAPGEGFLERDPSLRGPVIVLLLGGGGLLVVGLDAVGAQTPGRDTQLRAETAVDGLPHETLFGRDRDRVHRLCVRLVWGALAVGIVAVALAVVAVAAAGEPSGAAAPEVGVTDPAGLALVGVGVAWVGLVGSLVAYGVWSVTEYRRLRTRIRPPRPPSPFRHPSRVVTILGTDGEKLDAYGYRVKATGVAFALAVVLAGAPVVVVATA